MLSILFAIVLVPAAATPIADEPAVSGVVVDAEDKPIEGASVLLSCGVMPDGSVPVLARAMSDASGRFQLKWPAMGAMQAAEGYSVILWAVRDGLLAIRGLQKAVEPHVAEVQLKFQEPRSSQFKVVGPSGEAVKRIRVTPFQVYDQSVVLDASAIVPDELSERLAVESNDEGSVDFNGLPPRLELWRLRVTTPSGYSQVLMPAFDKPSPQPIVLGEPAGRFTGRVVDSSGRPIADVAVEVWSKPTNTGDSLSRVSIDAESSFWTDTDGRFSVPPRLLGSHDYRIAVCAADMEPCYSASMELRVGDDHRVPDLVLRPLRTIEGRVRDRAGNAVAAARVMQSGDGPVRTETKTDDQGRFRLSGFRQGDVFVLVDGQGFRFHGQVVSAKSTQVEMVLGRIDEPPTRTLRMLPSVLPADQERKIALELIQPYARQALEKPDGSNAFQLLDAMAELDPTTVLRWLDELPNIDSQVSGALAHTIVRKLAKEDLDEAVAVATSIKDEEQRMHALFDAGIVAKADRARRIELLHQAQLQAQAVNSPGSRIWLLSWVAGRWVDLGEPERARGLLREAQELAEKNAKDPFVENARWQLAENLAPLDLPAALAVLKDLKQNIVRDRPYLMIAIRLARTNPEEAERIFEQAGASLTGDSGYMKSNLCQRMAAADLPRARRLAASIDEPIWRTRAMFRVAHAVAESNPAAARDLIGECNAELFRMAELYPQQASYLAAGAIPLVEGLDPSLVQECIWRAIALRAPMCDVRESDRASLDDVGVAQAVALYDREVASHLFKSFENLLAAKDVKHMSLQLEALVLVDPRRALELATGLPDTAENPRLDFRKFTIVRVARMLARHDEARRRAILEPVGLWSEKDGDF